MKYWMMLLCLTFCSTAEAQTQRLQIGPTRNQTRQSQNAQERWDESKKLAIDRSVVPANPAERGACLKFPEQMKVGRTGLLEYWQFYVQSIVDDSNMILQMKNANAPPLWLTNYPTKGIVDGSPVRIVGVITVKETRDYQTVLGSMKRVWVVQHQSQEDIEQIKHEKWKREFRTWTSVNGEHVLLARFESYKSGRVKLQKEDKSFVEVEVDDLSRDDQDYFRGVLRMRAKQSE